MGSAAHPPWMVCKGMGGEGATGQVPENPTKGMRRGGITGGVEGKTPFTIEVAHFRYFVFEIRGSSTPNRVNGYLTFEKKRFADSGHGILNCDAFVFCSSQFIFRVRYGAPQVRILRRFG